MSVVRRLFILKRIRLREHAGQLGLYRYKKQGRKLIRCNMVLDSAVVC